MHACIILYSRVDIIEGTNNKIRKSCTVVVVVWTYRISGLDMYGFFISSCSGLAWTRWNVGPQKNWGSGWLGSRRSQKPPWWNTAWTNELAKFKCQNLGYSFLGPTLFYMSSIFLQTKNIGMALWCERWGLDRQAYASLKFILLDMDGRSLPCTSATLFCPQYPYYSLELILETPQNINHGINPHENDHGSDPATPSQAQPVLRPRILVLSGFCSTTMPTSWTPPKQEPRLTRRLRCGSVYEVHMLKKL